MKFEIINRYNVPSFDADEPFIVISVAEPRSDHPKMPTSKNLVAYKYYKFPDVETGEFYMDHTGEMQYPMHIDIAKHMIRFVMEHKDKVSLIVTQCDAGVSRSSAIAAAFSVILNGMRSDAWIFESPKYHPNMHVYSTLLTVYFGSYMP